MPPTSCRCKIQSDCCLLGSAKHNVMQFDSAKLMLYFNRQPKKLGLTLSRRSRKVVIEPRLWEPTMKNPLKGMIVWPIPDSKEVAVTVFKDPRTEEYEDKDWQLAVEDVILSNVTSEIKNWQY